MAADLSIPTGVTRRRWNVARAERSGIPHTPGPHTMTVGHIVAFEITDDAAHRQFGGTYRSAGELMWASGWGTQAVEVLAEDAAERGWWVDFTDRRSVLVRPEDLLGVVDTGPLEPGDLRAYDRVTGGPSRGKGAGGVTAQGLVGGASWTPEHRQAYLALDRAAERVGRHQWSLQYASGARRYQPAPGHRVLVDGMEALGRGQIEPVEAMSLLHFGDGAEALDQARGWETRQAAPRGTAA